MATKRQFKPKMGKPKLRVVGGAGKNMPPEFGPEDRQYFADLHRIIDDIYTEAADHFKWTWSQLAYHANLGYQTVCHIGDRQTRFPRFQTVYKLAKAVGWSLVTQRGKKNSRYVRLKIRAAG